jgi:hypothetical protein
MTLKTIVETLDDVPETAREFYQETEGGFVLQIAGVDAHPDVANLKNAYTRVKEDREALREKLKAIPDDFDPDQWKNVKTGKAKEEDLIKLRKELEAERDQWKTRAVELEGQTHKLTLGRQIDEALTANGITDPVYQKAARALIADGVQLKDGKAIVETDMGPLEISEHVKRWVSSGEGGAFVSAGRGGGASGGQKNNPAPKFIRSKMTATEKAAFIAEHGQSEYLKLPK